MIVRWWVVTSSSEHRLESEPVTTEVLATDVPTTAVRWVFTRRNLHELRHRIHPIPLGRGFSQQLVDRNWPGLTFAEAIALAGKAGAWCDDHSHWANLGVAESVKEVHVLVDGTIRTVEFTDAELAARDGDPDRLTPTG